MRAESDKSAGVSELQDNQSMTLSSNAELLSQKGLLTVETRSCNWKLVAAK
jgi:hypothetical protein